MSKPIHVVRFGYIKLSIWKNQTKSGDRHTVAAVRLYKDGEQWRESSRFGRDDLLLLAKAADMAHTWICAQSSNESEGPASTQGPSQ